MKEVPQVAFVIAVVIFTFSSRFILVQTFI